LAYEHFARYLFATRLANRKRILDIGSGEGYGAYLMAKTARGTFATRAFICVTI
jgi:predicted O-methyltransferase YrrM